MDAETSYELRNTLLNLFKVHGINAAVGLKPGGGIVIRSQDKLLDASNIGEVKAQDTKADD